MKFNLILLSAITLMTACGVSNEMIMIMKNIITYNLKRCPTELSMEDKWHCDTGAWDPFIIGGHLSKDLMEPSKLQMKRMTANILKKQSADLNKSWTETYQYCQENGGWMNYY